MNVIQISQGQFPVVTNESAGSHSLQRAEFCIGAYRARQGKLTQVLIGQKKKGGLRYVGSVQTSIVGLRPRLFRLLRMLHVYTFCPFIGIHEMAARSCSVLTERQLAQCQWVEASVKVWVEFEGWDASEQLVKPRVVGADEISALG